MHRGCRLLFTSARNMTAFSTSASSEASTSYIPPTSAPILRTSSSTETTASLASASSILRAGGLVAFPTETVYGLGASAVSSNAVQSIYKAKGRPSDNPLIVHISSRAMLLDLLPQREKAIPKSFEPLMRKFWPGALTLIFSLSAGDDKSPARTPVCEEVTAGHNSLGIRMPSHELAKRLIAETNLPLAAPSANLSSRPSPTTANHVKHDLGEGRGLGAILDGGECQVGLESTVVDFIPSSSEAEGGQLRILRAGGVTAEELEDCLKEAGFGSSNLSNGNTSTTPSSIKVYARDFRSKSLEAKPTTPGMKYKHYSPTNARVILVRPETQDANTPTLPDLIAFSTLASTSEKPYRVGIMLTDETLEKLAPTSSAAYENFTTCSIISLPSRDDSADADDEALPAPENPTQIFSYSLGSQTRPQEAAQRLFAGLRFLDELPADTAGDTAGVDVIFVESVSEQGVGLAVVERAKKAAGGADPMPFRIP